MISILNYFALLRYFIMSMVRLGLHFLMQITLLIRLFINQQSKQPVKNFWKLITWKAKRKLDVPKLPSKKVGLPLLLGEDIDKLVQVYLMKLCDIGGMANGTIARASDKSITRMSDPKLLASNGSHVVFTKMESKYLLKRMGFVKRKAISKARANIDGLMRWKPTIYLANIRTVISLEEVLPYLVINWDHIGLKYVPISSWTMAKKGFKKVP